MPRVDISKHLVHWTKGQTYKDAFIALRNIVSEQRLLGGNGCIRGGFNCVCFTEAPEAAFHQILGRYKHFGIRVSKAWLFAQGGRPVIYQRGEEYDLLPDEIKWRHVRYEPDANPPFDFSWEREWRVKCDELFLPPEEITIILPNEDWAQLLLDEHFYNEHGRITLTQELWGEWAAIEEPQPFQYKFSLLPA